MIATLFAPTHDLHERLLPHADNLEFQYLYEDGKRCRIPNEKGTTPWRAPINRAGSSGWDYVNQRCIFVGYDIDSKDNHAVGISTDDIEAIQEALQAVDWVEIRTSTSGKGGLHLYVWIDSDIVVASRKEHKAIAEFILAELAHAISRPSLTKEIDHRGEILWQYSAEMSGFELIKPATEKYQLRFAPLAVNDPTFHELAQAYPRVSLDAEHNRILSDLGSLGAWQSDIGLLHTHTVSLKRLAHLGSFDTNSPGTKLEQFNCFAAPMPHGSFRVYRFGNASEPKWTVTPSGVVTCVFNGIDSVDDLHKLFASHQARKPIKGKGFVLAYTEAVTLLAKLHIDLDLSPFQQQVRLELEDSGDLLVVIKADKGIQANERWEYERGEWKTRIERVVSSSAQVSDMVRAVRREGSTPVLFVKCDSCWEQVTERQAELLLTSRKIKAPRLKLGTAFNTMWSIVSRPFQPEYPEPNVWNRSRANWRIEAKPGPTPTWEKILDHIGGGLEAAVSADAWCQVNKIITGRDYLLHWLANLVRAPREPLPFLFLFSKEENTGKSTFPRSLARLFNDQAVAKIDKEFHKDFNSVMLGKILCVAEEVNLGTKEAHRRLKQWVEDPRIAIECKGRDKIVVDNTCHFIQCDNDLTACPLGSDDTRVVVISVSPLKSVMDRSELEQAVEAEAPAFRHLLQSTPKLPAAGRLYLPVLQTEMKDELLKTKEIDEWWIPLTKLEGVYSASDLMGSINRTSGAPPNAKCLGYRMKETWLTQKMSNYDRCLTVERDSITNSNVYRIQKG